MSKQYDGLIHKFDDGRSVAVCNNGEEFLIEFVNLEGEKTGFLLSPEAGDVLSYLIQEQLHQVGFVNVVD